MRFLPTLICFTAATVLSALSILGCETKKQKEERLAQQYCSACHLFPEPSLLPKKIWTKSVIPHMAFLMGFNNLSKIMALSQEERIDVMRSRPSTPMISPEELELIKNYYQREAPDSLSLPLHEPAQDLSTLFDITPITRNETPTYSLLRIDTINDQVILGNRTGALLTFDKHFQLIDSSFLSSTPAQINIKEKNYEVLLMGKMDPNDLSHGKLISFDPTTKETKTILDSLKRPVFWQQADLNKDKLQDYVVCAFGNYTGQLLAFEATSNSTYKRHVLLNSPGARHIVVQDFDNNGWPDIMALMTQGDEQITLFSNLGNWVFEATTLLHFPPVYGSGYFEVDDYNGDGNFDILYTNGDNADHSAILKPYHGVRLFTNDGTNEFKESWYYPMHGASQTRSHDYDEDGDIDVIAIAFFPDFTNGSTSLLYFENTGNQNFNAYSTPLAASGRWITLDKGDIDGDHDMDLILTALNFEQQIPKNIADQWRKKPVSALILHNKLN